MKGFVRICRKARLYFHTLYYLKPVQTVGRVLFHLKRVKLGPVPQLAAHFPIAAPVSFPCYRGLIPAEKTLCFLNQTVDLSGGVNWNDPRKSQLWLYNLHYFHYLLDEKAAEQRDWLLQLLHDWIDANPPGRGNAWLPYPLSLRITSWVKFFVLERIQSPKLLESLTLQLLYLAQRVEVHLQGNHLFENGKALLIGGLFFGSRASAAKTWFETGLGWMCREIPVQFRDDGSNFEQSPMYHAIMSENLLDLVNLMRAYGREVPRDWLERIPQVMRFLNGLTHPDGEIAFFNDSTFGIAKPTPVLNRYAERLELYRHQRFGALSWFKDSGFVRMERDHCVLILDGGPNGPDHIISHVHADNLSFELSRQGRRLLVNSGVSHYYDSPERLAQRGTAAHNTLELDGQDQSEVWASFRVARRARPLECQANERDGLLFFRGSHDGYRRLKGRVIHQRSLRWDRELLIEDRLSGSGTHQVVVYFHLHPDFGAFLQDQALEIRLADATPFARLWVPPAVEIEVKPTSWHPGFSLSLPNQTILVRTRAPLPLILTCRWEFL